MRSTHKMFITLGILVTAPLILSTLHANAQSFNCAKATASAEFAICNNEDLLTLDERLAAMYFISKSKSDTTPQRQKINKDQTQWIKRRNNCQLDWTCLKSRYQERIQALEVTL